ncbi:SOS response-associated peptidase [Dongia deserti]|uniref:SOS response-associated peptidase n=1 Tax=Dongia deserti TaxID=2268030 RepID=UPI000E65D4A9|nr:SOS response-associated peptidase [Dongia deserti]
MCGRYSFSLPPEAIRELFRVVTVLNLQPRYNIAPTQIVPVIGLEPNGERALRMFRWGLIPYWSKAMPKSAPLINARSEGIADNKMFGDAFHRRRCLVPADGFFEWNQDKSLKDRTPWRIVDPERPAFAFAGVWEGWRSPEGEIVRSFAIITTNANEKLARIHERMPVILKREDEDAWLDPNNAEPKLKSLLAPYDPTRTELYRVDMRVNSFKYDDPACLAKVE